ncbi:MAG: hypothetical protein A2426_08755 [Candidatus Lambdaproteobacteria bacterium RIFOXYC1_FULL_56_13]|nr:MAG: hypothetical protein A2426_08755 [Candidatus Lambdaproteobacteria bacterium RIFOXYC1_FULL_56_13]
MPGTGYVGSGQYGKALVIGGSRWALTKQIADLRHSGDLIPMNERFEIIPAEESTSGKIELIRRWNRQTWDEYMAFTWQLNLGFFSFWDLNAHDCKPNPETWQAALAPLRIDQFGGNWMFWLGIGATYAFLQSGAVQRQVVIRDEYYGGFTPEKQRRQTPLMFYPVGIGEEAMFRGSLQKSIFESLSNSGWGSESARHTAIWSAAALFGALHYSSAPTANPAGAFLLGAYQGYVYQPSIGKTDLVSAMALHTWFDILYNLTLLQISEDQEEARKLPLLSVGFSF